MDIKIGLIVILVIVALIIMLIGYFIKTSNLLTRLCNKCKELNSDIDVALTKRFDLLTKEYEAAKMYCDHESSTLINAIKVRNGMTQEEKETATKQMDKLTRNLKVTVEAYPQLHANENIMQLQKSCENTEEHLQAARRIYNISVTNYNNMCMEFPSSIVASFTSHKSMEYFKADDEKRKDVSFI